jgi:IS30 family transposase
MAKMGRKRIEIDQNLFEKLCVIHCTLEEIAGILNCAADTVERWAKRTYNRPFAEVKAQKASTGKMSLRRKMFEMANNGDRVMLIWLSKQHLGMSEKTESKIDQHTQGDVVYRAEWGSQIETTPTAADPD